MRRLLRSALCAALLAIACAPAAHGHGGASVSYGAGWQLVAGPTGSSVRGAVGPLYTFQAGDRSYQTLPASQPLVGGRGYWAFLPSGGTIVTGDGAAPCAASVSADQGWVLIGNPSPTHRAIVLDRDQPLALAEVLVYDAEARAYRSILRRIYVEGGPVAELASADLEPGQAAWLRLSTDGMVTIDGCTA